MRVFVLSKKANQGNRSSPNRGVSRRSFATSILASRSRQLRVESPEVPPPPAVPKLRCKGVPPAGWRKPTVAVTAGGNPRLDLRERVTRSG